jgi:Tfp pilus assembly protein PilO
VGSKRGPLIAGAVVVVVVLMTILFLVLPKMGEVSDAKDELAQAKSEQTTLLSRKQALLDAQEQAPESRATIKEVDRQIPPTADEPGLILLLQNAAAAAGMDIVSFTPGTPVFDAATGLSTISVAISGEGTYFDVTEFMYRIETLPRAAKTTTVSLSPGETTGTGVPTLAVSATLEVYTSDASAGPGSIPGPTEATQAGGA